MVDTYSGCRTSYDQVNKNNDYRSVQNGQPIMCQIVEKHEWLIHVYHEALVCWMMRSTDLNCGFMVSSEHQIPVISALFEPTIAKSQVNARDHCSLSSNLKTMSTLSLKDFHRVNLLTNLHRTGILLGIFQEHLCASSSIYYSKMQIFFTAISTKSNEARPCHYKSRNRIIQFACWSGKIKT